VTLTWWLTMIFFESMLGMGDLEMRYVRSSVCSSVLPKQVGNTRRRSDRMAGRQQQMMLTKASRQLQYAAGTLSSVEGAGVGWSVVGLGHFVSGDGGGEDRQGLLNLHVGFVVLEKWTRA